MSNNNLSFSNSYLKMGAGLILIAVAAMAWTFFFSVDQSLQTTTRNICMVLLPSGLIVYLIGRVIKASHANQRDEA